LSLDGDPKLASAVSGGAVKIVSGDQPRGIEQALLLLGATNDHHADERIPALLVGPRPELRIAADVAVRRLRIQSALPTLAVRLGEIMTQLEQQHAAALTNSKAVMSDAEFINLGEEASQIAQALGEMDYEPAEAMLRKLVPKSPIYPGNMRPAAVWALGRLHAGTPDNRLVGELMDRATDHSIQMPESPLVQTMAVEAIGMMHATNAVAPLQKIIDTGAAPDQFTAACRWAIGQLTGHEPPPPPAQQITAHGFFLEAKH
jgi:HEAT repeat protein